jgi:hypothetical protein
MNSCAAISGFEAPRLASRAISASCAVSGSRTATVLQGGERQLHLRLDPGYPGNPQASGRPDGVLQQGGLADAWFSAQHKHAALPGSRRIEQAGECRTFRETV